MTSMYIHILASILLYFFFSSRRRHTRSLRDWSSDVCSSDLWKRSTAPSARRRRRTGSDATAAAGAPRGVPRRRSEEHTSELQSRRDLVCRLLLEKKKYKQLAI